MKLSKLTWFSITTLFLLTLAGLIASMGDGGSLVMFDQDYSHNPLAWMVVIPAIVLIVILGIMVAAGTV